MKWLLISNVGIFLLQALLTDRGADPWELRPFEAIGFFSIETAFGQFQVWRLISFQFLHADFFHILFNMWMLYVMAPFLERWWGSRAFLLYYLLCGVGGALLYSLLVMMPGILPDGMIGARLIGASAGVLGAIIGVAVLAPQGQIRLLFPPIAMKMRTFAILVLCLDLYILLTNSSNAGGSAGHLGGAMVGFLLMRVPVLRGWLVKMANSKGVSVKIVKKPKPQSKIRPKSELSGSESSEVDRILDKINNEGLQSLTDKERELLRRAAGK